MKELINELKKFIQQESFIWTSGDWIEDCLCDYDKVIYADDILDKIQELEKKYLINFTQSIDK